MEFSLSIFMASVLAISRHKFVLGCYLIPGFVLGCMLSGRIAQWLDRGYSRLAALVLSSVSALVLIWKSLTE